MCPAIQCGTWVLKTARSRFSLIGEAGTILSFRFSGSRDVDIISIHGLVLKVGEQSEEVNGGGECIVSKSKNAVGCQARIDDGRLVIGTIFVDTR